MRNKWNLHRVMKKSGRLRPHLPETKRYHAGNLRNMLARHRTVMIKPCRGRFGCRIVKVAAKSRGRYEVHYEDRRFIVKTKRNIISYMNRWTRRRSYIIQQYIPLAAIRQRPFDIRVMVQRRRNKSWIVTGKMVRVAHANYVVTNVAAYALKIKKAIRLSSARIRSARKLKSGVNRLSLHTVRHLSRFGCRNRSVMGLDIALDRNGKLWVIEVNLRPTLAPFRLLKDRSMYRRIKRFRSAC